MHGNPVPRSDSDFTSVSISKQLHAELEQACKNAPWGWHWNNPSQVAQMAIRDFLERRGIYRDVLTWTPKPHQCHVPECQQIVTLLPLTTPTGITFVDWGHKPVCPYFRADPKKAEEGRQATRSIPFNWPVFFENRTREVFDTFQNLNAREEVEQLEKKAQDILRRRDQRADSDSKSQ